MNRRNTVGLVAIAALRLALSCRRFTHILTLGFVGLMAPTAALAQMPPDVAEKIAALGRVIELDNTAIIYEPLAE
jgi:hypothetical protein